MPYKGKAPLTITLIQPVIPGLVIESITKEEPITIPSQPEDVIRTNECCSDVKLARMTVADCRGNEMFFVSKRTKWKAACTTVGGGRDFTLSHKAQDLSSRHNECNFFLHYASSYTKAHVPRCFSIKAPTEKAVTDITAGEASKYTTFTLLFSDLSSVASPYTRVTSEYLDYYQTVAALVYIANFHAVFWEAKDDEGVLWKWGGHGGDDYDVSEGETGAGGWAEGSLSDNLDVMKAGVRKRFVEGLAQKRRARTVVHGDYRSGNMMMLPWVEGGGSEYIQMVACDFKKSGKGYGMQDVSMLLGRSVDPALLMQESREDEFLEIYFNTLIQSLKEARKPPLPPGYKWDDCKRSYELCVLDAAIEMHTKDGAAGGTEYLMWRTRGIVDRLEKNVADLASAMQWKNSVYSMFPL